MKKNNIGKLLLLINTKAFPFLVSLTFFFLFLETYLYIGFLRKFFLADSRFFLIVSIFSATTLVLLQKDVKIKTREKILNNLVFQLNTLLFPSVLIFYLIMQAAEVANYSNYVFSTFHLQPDNFFYIVVLSAGLLLLDWAGEKKETVQLFSRRAGIFLKDFKKRPTRSALKLAVIVLLLFYFIDNFTKTLNTAINSNIYILTHLNDSYDDKMRQKWGFYYDYMKFVKQNTPEDSIIVAPPMERPWLTTGNTGLNRYFLYPRRLVRGTYDSLPEENYDFILITKGGWYTEDEGKYGWPKVEIKVNRVLYLDPLTRKVTIDSYYDFEESLEKGGWGIIDVRNN